MSEDDSREDGSQKREQDVLKALKEYGKKFVSLEILYEDIYDMHATSHWQIYNTEDTKFHGEVDETVQTLVETGKVEQAEFVNEEKEERTGYRLKQ